MIIAGNRFSADALAWISAAPLAGHGMSFLLPWSDGNYRLPFEAGAAASALVLFVGLVSKRDANA